MRIRYSTAKDTYYRGLEDDVTPGNYDVRSWRNGIHSATSVCRKEEHDWKMTYLAREEGTESSKICWIVDVSDSGFDIDEVIVHALFTTFQDGEVKMELKEDGEGITKMLDGVSDVTLKSSGQPVLKLTASLRCEKNDKDHCWQHSQIFRQSLNSQNEYPLDITVTLKPKTKNEESLK